MAVHFVHENSFPVTMTIALYSLQSRRGRAGFWREPNSLGVAPQRRAAWQQPGRGRGIVSAPPAGSSRGRGCGVSSDSPRTLPGDPCISTSQRPGFVKCLQSPWNPKGTRRKTQGAGGGVMVEVLGPRPLSPLEPGPAAELVGSCGPKEAAARRMRDTAYPRLPLTC